MKLLSRVMMESPRKFLGSARESMQTNPWLNYPRLNIVLPGGDLAPSVVSRPTQSRSRRNYSLTLTSRHSWRMNFEPVTRTRRIYQLRSPPWSSMLLYLTYTTKNICILSPTRRLFSGLQLGRSHQLFRSRLSNIQWRLYVQLESYNAHRTKRFKMWPKNYSFNLLFSLYFIATKHKDLNTMARYAKPRPSLLSAASLAIARPHPDALVDFSAHFLQVSVLRIHSETSLHGLRGTIKIALVIMIRRDLKSSVTYQVL